MAPLQKISGDRNGLRKIFRVSQVKVAEFPKLALILDILLSLLILI